MRLHSKITKPRLGPWLLNTLKRTTTHHYAITRSGRVFSRRTIPSEQADRAMSMAIS